MGAILLSLAMSYSAASEIDGEDLAAATAELVSVVTLVLITVLGINWTYKTNGGNQGKDYVARVTALLVPISINIALLLVLSAFLVLVIKGGKS